jgi:hypothetical protein
MRTLSLLTVAGALAAAAPALATPPSATTTAKVPSAQSQCRTERDAVGRSTFALTYGANANRANAFGKCVSKRNAATRAARRAARVNAAQQCRAAQQSDAAAFAAAWGQGRNAYGKCVSTTAREQTAATVRRQVKAHISAARSCRDERRADPAAFAARYGTGTGGKHGAFRRCVATTAAVNANAR